MSSEKSVSQANRDLSTNRRSMRLACVIHSLDGGGAERVMAGLSSRLAQRGHDVTLLTLDDGSASRHALDSLVQWCPLDVMTTPKRRVSAWHRLKTLRQTIVLGQFDRVLSFCDSTNLTTLLAMVGVAIPVIVSERSDPAQQSLGRLKEALRRRLYRRAASVICQSDEVADWLASHANVEAVVIASAVDPPPVGWQPVKNSSPTLRFLAIGRLEYEKGFDRLLNALSMLPRSSGDWRLTICGEGTLRGSLQSLAESIGIGERVSMPGWVTPITNALAESDVFVLPSRYEGFPSALMEAMACGLAVVAVDAGGGVRQIIRNGENGILLPNQDESLLSGLSQILNDPPLRNRISQNAPDVLNRFGWETMLDAYEAVLISPKATSK